MTPFKRLLLLAMITCVADAWGQPETREPHVGYLYPAGGCQDSVFRITAGGQRLQGVTSVYVSGEGVHASVIRHYRPLRKLDKAQRQELQRRLNELWEKRWAEMRREGRAPMLPGMQFAGKATGKPGAKETETTTAEGVKLPEHPLLENLENLSLRGLAHVANEIMNSKKRQPNAQIAEMVLIEVAIDPDAPPGDRELRLGTPAGLTNPMSFQVGLLPEVCEQEPNDTKAYTILPEEPPLDIPVLLNGQIMPGDVDRFRFGAQRGERLVMEAQARRLIPYLADAVPGWFQATMTLYDAWGNEAVFDDDYRFNPDPVLFYKIPEDGEYELEIRDALYRGREDFVYRIAVGEQPFITRMFPLGGRMGVKTVASIAGWNLSKKRLPLDTQPGDDCIRQTALRQGKWLSNRILYAVDTLPEYDETEPNDNVRDAQRISLPRIVNGRIAQPGDVDVFRFKGRAGDEVAAEVYARRLYSPLDSVLRLTDASGRVLEWNDDHEDKETGLLTHHADSYLCVRLPEDGVYCVHLGDSQHHGGEAYTYRLRITPPRPDFALRVTPSSMNVPTGRTVPVCVYALRNDGFDGDIELVLKDAPAGFTLNGARIPSGRDRLRMTLTAPREPLDQPVVLRLEGQARIAGQTVSRPVVPSEDMMQAFLYRHLVPSQELMIAVTGPGRRGPPVELADDVPVRIPAGGTAWVRIKTPKNPKLQDIRLALSEPPEGVTLQEVRSVPDGLALLLKADGDALRTGFADNLIVEAFTEAAGAKQDGKAAKKKQRVSLGVLPAIPFEVVQP